VSFLDGYNTGTGNGTNSISLGVEVFQPFPVASTNSFF